MSEIKNKIKQVKVICGIKEKDKGNKEIVLCQGEDSGDRDNTDPLGRWSEDRNGEEERKTDRRKEKNERKKDR